MALRAPSSLPTQETEELKGTCFGHLGLLSQNTMGYYEGAEQQNSVSYRSGSQVPVDLTAGGNLSQGS